MKFQNLKCVVISASISLLIIYRKCTLDCNQPCVFARQLIEFGDSAATEQSYMSYPGPAETKLRNLASLTR